MRQIQRIQFKSGLKLLGSAADFYSGESAQFSSQLKPPGQLASGQLQALFLNPSRHLASQTCSYFGVQQLNSIICRYSYAANAFVNNQSITQQTAALRVSTCEYHNTAPLHQAPRRADQPQPTTEYTKSSALEEKTDLDKISSSLAEPPPVGLAEGTSYTVVILIALGIVAAVAYALVTQLIFEPVDSQCFNASLERLRNDPRVTVRLGESIRGYGHDSHNRMLRRQVPHQIYRHPTTGREHCQIFFHVIGDKGKAAVTADLYKGTENSWQFALLRMEVLGPGMRQQVELLDEKERMAHLHV